MAVDRKPIPALPHEWGDFLTCVLLHMLLPLLPLLMEAWQLGSPTEPTCAITAAMYAFGIGLSSRNKSMLGLCIIIGAIFSVVFGVVSATAATAVAQAAPATGVSSSPASIPATVATQISHVRAAALVSIGMVFLIHAMERYNKHVVDCIPFWELGKSEG
ncbi:hypothetical protein O166_05520 [Pseudogulbenkiania ferrooxidans EGD-HP2]|uniref:Transmembrane protein n=1 Tax=Pseudogulbenkiania ferrooxidans EGD-HP2 TaxID=1388764 RepID=A0ABN0N813_9NEIS|nr:hypothetical protein O166_05520 [Pseudogulbenkiania ferrooxidans EGD-HP2]